MALYNISTQQELDPEVQGSRAFRSRHELSDLWYDLHNPEQASTPITIQCTTDRENFPSNLDDVEIEEILLYVAGAEDTPLDGSLVTLSSLRPEAQPL